MRDIDAPSQYSQGNESEFRREVNRSINRCYSNNKDVLINLDQRACFQSPDGNWWRLKVDNSGVVSTEAIVL